MKIVKCFIAFVFLIIVAEGQAYAGGYDRWSEVLAGRSNVNVYVADKVNTSGDPNISTERSTQVVKQVFSDRRNPVFTVVDSPGKADIVFEGEVYDYVWMEKAPVTNMWSAGALAMDLATRSDKNYARKLIRYRIYNPSNNRELLAGTTQVTIKQAGMPEDKSYDMIYERTKRMLSMDLFSRWERNVRR